MIKIYYVHGESDCAITVKILFRLWFVVYYIYGWFSLHLRWVWLLLHLLFIITIIGDTIYPLDMRKQFGTSSIILYKVEVVRPTNAFFYHNSMLVKVLDFLQKLGEIKGAAERKRA